MLLYLGDDDQSRAAAYLSGVLTYHGIPFERVDSTSSPSEDFMDKQYDGYIISDYPAARFKSGQMEHIRDSVARGAGICMIGGWESFHGKNGEYCNSPIADILPVTMETKDDRHNCSQPVMVFRNRVDHPILSGLPWKTPPFVGGYNAFAPKADARTLLRGVKINVRIQDENQVVDCRDEGVCSVGGVPIEQQLTISLLSAESIVLNLMEVIPLLVVGQFEKGRTAALATDVAPHWIGGFVDWGDQRISQSLPGNIEIEVGANYAQFFAQLAKWILNQCE
ncbi:MAG: glutamine amidotransferase [Thermoguttaceae bacterium]